MYLRLVSTQFMGYQVLEEQEGLGETMQTPQSTPSQTITICRPRPRPRNQCFCCFRNPDTPFPSELLVSIFFTCDERLEDRLLP